MPDPVHTFEHTPNRDEYEAATDDWMGTSHGVLRHVPSGARCRIPGVTEHRTERYEGPPGARKFVPGSRRHFREVAADALADAEAYLPTIQPGRTTITVRRVQDVEVEVDAAFCDGEASYVALGQITQLTDDQWAQGRVYYSSAFWAVDQDEAEVQRARMAVGPL